MKLLKYLSLCLGLCLLLIGCNGKEPAPSDPALTQAPATTHEAPAPETSSHDANACQTTPDPGPCKAQIEKFYFDPATKKCTSFTYGGCQGTVPFETMQSCQSSCEVDNTSAAIGCLANGMEYHIGDTWSQACNTCTCTSTGNGPTAICTDTPCDTTATPMIQVPADTMAPATTVTPVAPAPAPGA
jgi:hypothetical protein